MDVRASDIWSDGLKVEVTFEKGEKEILEKAMKILKDAADKLSTEGLDDLACVVGNSASGINTLLNSN